MTEKTARWVWLSQCFSYGAGKLGKLLNAGVDPDRFYEEGEEYRRSFGILDQRDFTRIRSVSIDRAYRILDRCRELNIWVVCWDDPTYPEGLRNIFGAPAVLYGKGELNGIWDTLRITVVGTRKSDDYAKRAAGNLSYQLSKAGVTIVSGCAVGIDEFAHRGAVKAQGRSVGILACGADVNYPAANQLLKEKMLEYGGALITELPPGTEVNRHYFPTRNRLLAGISEGIVVIQAPVRSGALITAELAIEQGKELFCLPPADIFHPAYMGVIPYLRDGAKPVYAASDILEEYEARWGDVLSEQPMLPVRSLPPTVSVPQKLPAVADTTGYTKEKSNAKLPALSGKQREIYDLLTEEPLPVDVIIRASRDPAHQVLAVLTELELMGVVRVFPGRMYAKADSLNE